MGKIASDIPKTLRTGKPIKAPLKTDERVLARITEGIYRQPSSALRELISNAYDADATEVTILTDAPRFSKVIVRDNGNGLKPETLENLIEHIGASPKKSRRGAKLGVTDPENPNRSRGGRKLIGQMGIGLFSVAQLTRHFQIITKTEGSDFRTVADITLNMQADDAADDKFDAGHAMIWAEPAEDKEWHGTEIILLDLRKTTRDELASRERWERIDAQQDSTTPLTVTPPRHHIGRVSKADPNVVETPPQLPWNVKDAPRERFRKLVQAVFDEVGTTQNNPSLDVSFDKYLQLLWTLSLAAPLQYVETHPFDLKGKKDLRFFELSNEPRGQAKEISLKADELLRDRLNLQAPERKKGDSFSVSIDGVELLRPIRFSDLPSTENAIDTPLMFVGSYKPDLSKLPPTLSGGPLHFEAYLLWTPLVVPTQHRGVLIRIGEAAGTPFDPHFMGYQVSEQQRLRQLTAEIFIHEGLDHAINIDRESFNFAHPHYQLIVKWLHGAIKQFANKQKGIGKELRDAYLNQASTAAAQALQEKVTAKLKALGVRKSPEVILVDDEQTLEAVGYRKEGKIVLSKSIIFPPSDTAGGRTGKRKKKKLLLADEKVKAVTKLLHAWGALSDMPYADQQRFIADVVDILTFSDGV
jgi:hypothetical protein